MSVIFLALSLLKSGLFMHTDTKYFFLKVDVERDSPLFPPCQCLWAWLVLGHGRLPAYAVGGLLSCCRGLSPSAVRVAVLCIEKDNVIAQFTSCRETVCSAPG